MCNLKIFTYIDSIWLNLNFKIFGFKDKSTDKNTNLRKSHNNVIGTWVRYKYLKLESMNWNNNIGQLSNHPVIKYETD